MWKLNAGLEGLLLPGMEIALPHVISHAKALLSTFTSFASFSIKRIHGGTVLLGRWIHFRSRTEAGSVGACEISHVNTMNTGDLLQSFTMNFMHYLPLALLLHLSFCNTVNWSHLQNICKKKKAVKAERGNLMDIKIGLLPYTELPSFFKHNIKSINAVKEIERRNGRDRAVKIEWWSECMKFWQSKEWSY